ncbi:DUF664 domain-containing protein [Streptomyces sp. NPDC091268]|uniref:mycothiol transferase n=1 Tax=Streptomyces sp. NPDC091268 TaxID=3365979 RepID=UPI00380825C4
MRDRRLTLEPKPAWTRKRRRGGRWPSGPSLLGLVRHLAGVERKWFRGVMAGEPVRRHYRSEAEPDGEFTAAVADAAVVADAWARWRAEVAPAERLVAAAPDLRVTGGHAGRFRPGRGVSAGPLGGGGSRGGVLGGPPREPHVVRSRRDSGCGGRPGGGQARAAGFWAGRPGGPLPGGPGRTGGCRGRPGGGPARAAGLRAGRPGGCRGRPCGGAGSRGGVLGGAPRECLSAAGSADRVGAGRCRGWAPGGLEVGPWNPAAAVRRRRGGGEGVSGTGSPRATGCTCVRLRKAQPGSSVCPGSRPRGRPLGCGVSRLPVSGGVSGRGAASSLDARRVGLRPPARHPSGRSRQRWCLGRRASGSLNAPVRVFRQLPAGCLRGLARSTRGAWAGPGCQAAGVWPGRSSDGRGHPARGFAGGVRAG